MIIRKIVILIIVLISFNLGAIEYGSDTGFELNRFISLKSNDVNLRVGPSKNYPIKLKYIIKNYPVIVIEEYMDWRKIIDIQDNEGWIHKSLLKGERYGILNSKNKEFINVYNTAHGIHIGNIYNNNIVKLDKCKPKWCLVKLNNYKGWVEKKYIWGVRNKETFNITFLQKITDIYWKSNNLLYELITNKK